MADRKKVIRELKAARLFFEMGSNRADGVVGNLGCKSGMKYIDDALALLKEQPDIVRCRDCKYMERLTWLDVEAFEAMVCRKHNYTGMREEDFFCADGERRCEND